MVSRIRRRFSSFAYFARKTYWKMATAKPSLTILGFAVVGLSIFLLGGGVYDLIVPFVPIGFPLGRRVLFFYPRTIHEQAFLGSLLVMTVYGIGVAGFLLTYQSTKYAYRSRQAFTLLSIGLVLVFIAYLLIEYVLWLKMLSPL
ncbi:MAG: hypothetical protein OEX76_08000 [Candidatus Bathyarchaeota archaeon]|nr:hypothetical protein [Candidatus Bathyarchaeota archaeon]MDH5532787.1 hypothetical protein [Candidatus Bathyarchaeota archaeon]